MDRGPKSSIGPLGRYIWSPGGCMAAAIDAVVWMFRFKNAFVEKFNPVFFFFGCGRPAAKDEVCL